jgi:lysophospholipase L1-like esterase
MLDFAFAFQFNIHKSHIPLGIEDHDYRRLQDVYGVGRRTILEEAAKIGAANARHAKELLKDADVPEDIRSAGETRISFLGDSITSDRQSYMNIIQCALSEYGGISVADYAVSGFKSGDLLTMLFPDVIAVRADIVSIMIGTNDMRRTDDAHRALHTGIEEYEKNVRYVVEKLTGSGSRVILTTIPPFCMDKINASLDGYNILYTEDDRSAFNSVIRRIARDCGACLNDMDETYSKHPTADLTLDDGLHLNELGQRLLAGKLFPEILRMIRQEHMGCTTERG